LLKSAPPNKWSAGAFKNRFRASSAAAAAAEEEEEEAAVEQA
jgi:hypothetical protein